MNFGELQTRVADWLNRDDLSSVIPTWINMTMMKIERAHNFRYMRQSSTIAGATLTDGITTTLPARYKGLESAQWIATATGAYKRLKKCEAAYAREVYSDPAYEAEPELIAVEGGNFLLLPKFAGAGSLIVNYYQKSAELSAAGDTNWLTENAWDLLLYGSLLEGKPYLADANMVPEFEKLFAASLSSLVAEEQRERYQGSPQFVKAGAVVV